MREVYKSLRILDNSDFSIIKHHIIDKLELEFECKFKEDSIIDFYDEYLYDTIKTFIKHTKIKFNINKEI